MSTALQDARAEIERAIANTTVCSEFVRTAADQPDEPALRWRAGDGFAVKSWREYADEVAAVASGLRRLGVGRGDRVALLTRNRPEFHVADLGALFAGATPVSLYNSSPPAQIEYVLGHSGATVVVVENEAFATRVASVRDNLPALRHVVVIEPGASPPPDEVPFASLLAEAPVDLTTAAAEVAPDDLATIIYTSGTTGPPKGVMLTHHNVRYAVEIYARVMPIPLRGLREVSYLPMAHIAERLATHYFHALHGTVVTTCADITALPEYMVDVRPQWWFCAPRLWERLQAGVVGLAGADASPDQQRDALARLGLDEVRVAVTGSAPLPRSTFEFFRACGIPLSDCYGQSETTGFVSWDPDDVVPGTSGKPFPGVEVRIADDGEIVVRGPNVFAGYLNDPERTAEVLDADGWLRTGDLGRFDDGGNLVVLGRKREMLVPSSGHKVSPVALEAALKEHPLVREACAVGDGRPFIAALVVLDPEVAPGWARDRGIDDAAGDLAAHPDVVAEVQRGIDLVNERFARAEQIRAFALVGDEWIPDSDVLTPTSKVKRAAVHDRYAREIDGLYAE